MKKLLLICSAVAIMCGDCVWGMDDIDPWRGTSSGAGQFSTESAWSKSGPNVRSRRNSRQFNAEPTQENEKASYQDAQTQTEQSQFQQYQAGQTQANPYQLQENRFIKDNGFRQYHYAPSNNSKIGRATPTTIISVSGDLRCWNDISEIRYANDVFYDKLENPKVILYRNKDNSCYIILQTDNGKKYGVFYGLNERNVEIGRNSFAVYDVSGDVGSFTDGVERLIYVDESGLYFVPENANPVEDVIETYQNEGKFNFKGSVIKVSAIDGTITWNGEPVTEDNFFDNWVKEEREVEREVSGNRRGTFVEKVKQTQNVLSTKQPNENEVLRNFYPPVGYYDGILKETGDETSLRGKNVYVNYLSTYSKTGSDGKVAVATDQKYRNWFNSFINNRLQIAKARSKSGAEELVRNGTFSLILSKCGIFYLQKVRDAMEAQVKSWNKPVNTAATAHPFYAFCFKDGSSSIRSSHNISGLIQSKLSLFEDPEFVRSLKPAFKELEKDYEHNKESELWIPFEIVRNL